MEIKFYNQLWSLDPPFYVLGLHFYQQSPSAGMGGWFSRLLFVLFTLYFSAFKISFLHLTHSTDNEIETLRGMCPSDRARQ